MGGRRGGGGGVDSVLQIHFSSSYISTKIYGVGTCVFVVK